MAVTLHQSNAQSWSTLANICDGPIALHKCNWQLISWETHLGHHLSMVQDPPSDLILWDCYGPPSTIPYLPPDQPNVGLGYQICPNGDQMPQYRHVHDAISHLCRSASGTHLTEHEVHILFCQRMIPKLSYALHSSSFMEQQCSCLNTLICTAFLPGLRLNRHYPSAVLYGPIDYGGMAFLELYTLQDQVQLDYLLKQLCWDRMVLNDFLVTLDSVQLCLGFLTSLLVSPSIRVDFLDNIYIIDLQCRLAKMGVSLWIKQAWAPCLQWEGNSALMEQFCNMSTVTQVQLCQANDVHLYIQVHSIADVHNIPGTHIHDGMLDGDWQAGSNIQWPFQPKPPKPFCVTFHWCLRNTFCCGHPPHQPALYSMKLNHALGRWLPVQRTTWFTAYQSLTHLYWGRLNDEMLHVMKRSCSSGFFHFNGTTMTLPLDCHPVSFQQVGGALRTQPPYLLGPAAAPDPLLPRYSMVENTLSCHPVRETITLGSDGSVHLSQQVAACAWMIHDSDDKYAKACFLLSNIMMLSSYHSELEGICCSLKHVEYLGLTPAEITHWCDNKAAVHKSMTPFWKPSQMIIPNADILLAIHHTTHQ